MDLAALPADSARQQRSMDVRSGVVSAAVAWGWLEEANTHEGQWKLEAQGAPPTTRFVLSFEGSPQTVARRAAQALEGMRLGAGQSRKLAAPAAAAAAAAGGGTTPLYVREYKSKQQVKVEAQLWKAARILRDMLIGRQVRQLRREGVLTIGWRKLLRADDAQVGRGRPAVMYKVGWEPDGASKPHRPGLHLCAGVGVAHAAGVRVHRGAARSHAQRGVERPCGGCGCPAAARRSTSHSATAATACTLELHVRRGPLRTRGASWGARSPFAALGAPPRAHGGGCARRAHMRSAPTGEARGAALQTLARAVCRSEAGLVRMLARDSAEVAQLVAGDKQSVRLADVRACVLGGSCGGQIR